MAKGIVLDQQSVPGSVGQTNPLPVRIKDGVTGSDVPVAEIATTLYIYNVVLAAANTEYSQLLPEGTKSFKIYAVDSTKTIPHRTVLKYTMSGPNGNDWSAIDFIPIPAGGWDGDANLKLSGKTIYFQSPTGGNAVVIIKVWT